MAFTDGPLAPPPLLRMLRGADAPFAGELRAGEPPTVWVPLQDLPPEIWRVRPDEHVLAPVDLARTPGGHAALMPHCPHRLSALLVEGVWDPGAIVTLTVSMLRGAAEAERRGITSGSWWVDAAGRPVLAPTGTAWHDETTALLRDVAERAGPALRRAVMDAAALIGDGRASPARRERIEDALFSAAEPGPLPAAGRVEEDSVPARRVVDLPRNAADEELRASVWDARILDREIVVRTHDALAAMRSTLRRVTRSVRVRRRALISSTERTTRDAPSDGLADARSAATHRRRRAAPALVAAAVGTAVVVVGLAWPTEDRPSAASAPPSSETSVRTPSAEQTTPAPGDASPPDHAPISMSEDGADVARWLLEELASCTGRADHDCTDVLEDPGQSPPTSVASDRAAPVDVSLLDEYGGVAAYRVTRAGGRAQVLVLVRVDGKWLIRDVYDVADQP